MEDDNILRQQRIKKSQELRDQGVDLYPSFNGAENRIGDILAQYAASEILPAEETAPPLRTAGRLMTVRDFGKSLFFHVQDGTGRLQGYLKKDRVGPETFALFKKLDIGDFVG